MHIAERPRVSPVEGVDMLFYGEMTNLREITRCLSNKAMVEYGILGYIIEGLCYKVPPEIEYDRERVKHDSIYRKIVEAKVTKKEELIAKAEKTSLSCTI